MIRCEICGRGPKDGVTVYRSNPKGQPGKWRCADHPSKESFGVQHDPAIRAIDEALDKERP